MIVDLAAGKALVAAVALLLRDLDFHHFPHPRILYEYDFGDSWLHWIEFDPQMPSEDGIKYPICVDGARHCPPEDVGGPRGYADFLKAWCDPTHDLLPGGRELAPRHLLQDVKNHALLRFPKGEAARRYNTLQKLSYLGVVFVLIPLQILTGLTMSPAMDAAWPWLVDVFGGRPSARSIHFICRDAPRALRPRARVDGRARRAD